MSKMKQGITGIFIIETEISSIFIITFDATYLPSFSKQNKYFFENLQTSTFNFQINIICVIYERKTGFYLSSFS